MPTATPVSACRSAPCGLDCTACTNQSPVIDVPAEQNTPGNDDEPQSRRCTRVGEGFLYAPDVNLRRVSGTGVEEPHLTPWTGRRGDSDRRGAGRGWNAGHGLDVSLRPAGG